MKSKRKRFDGEIKLKLSGKRLFQTDSVKYLGVKLMEIFHGNVI